MKEDKDFVFVKQAGLNEGLSTGTMTEAALFFTKQYLFVVPLLSLSVLGYTAKETSTNSEDLLKDIIPQLKEQSVEDFVLQMTAKLPPERVYVIAELETFSINVGWWIFGGMTIKKKGGSRQTINLQPKGLRASISQFYAQ